MSLWWSFGHWANVFEAGTLCHTLSLSLLISPLIVLSFFSLSLSLQMEVEGNQRFE